MEDTPKGLFQIEAPVEVVMEQINRVRRNHLKGGLLNRVQRELRDETAQLITAIHNLFLKTTLIPED